jgi:hypothetical protein
VRPVGLHNSDHRSSGIIESTLPAFWHCPFRDNNYNVVAIIIDKEENITLDYTDVRLATCIESAAAASS